MLVPASASVAAAAVAGGLIEVFLAAAAVAVFTAFAVVPRAIGMNVVTP